ncbi:MAG: ABC transporter substrate-binding protein [Nocardioides sp.]|nr:ABC transporter substrate-binding protein [Nocardioides sp.]
MKPFRERNPVVIGAVSITVLVLLLVAAFRASDLPIIGGGTIYYANFEEAGGLKADDEVRLAGVRVGRVEDIALDQSKGEVRVTFRVETDDGFGTESRAAIKVKTLLGDMFLSLEPAGDGQLAEETTIPSDRTSSPYDVVDAFEGLAETSAEIDTDQLAQSLTTLADLTRDTPEEFRSALTGVSALSRNIARRDRQINSLLKNLRRVSTVLDDRDDDIIALMRDSDVLFRALVTRRDDIHQVLVATQTLSRELTLLVRQSRGDLKPALTQLKSVLDVLNKNEDNIDDSLRLMAPFYRVFNNTLGTGPWFDTYIYNLPPVPTLGGVADTLNPTNRAAAGGGR